MDILKQLNEKQREAVTHKGGPTLVLAGPGTGKTKVITHRVVYLVREYGVEPQNILAVTFTNRAAQEMRNRISRPDMLGYEHAQNIWVDTFHAASVSILRENAEECGLNPNFTIFDQETQQEILEECVHSLRLSTESYPLWMLKNIISFYKGRGIAPNDVPPEEIRSREGEIFGEDEEEEREKHLRNTVRIINAYQSELRKYDAFDFDDLIVEAVNMLSDFPDIREKYHQNLHHILVDEYQDINTAQYEFLKLLCGEQKNVMVVADDDQSIYSWRGSEPAHIDHFKEDFDSKVIELEEHYRSTQTILDAAQALIENNNTRRKTGKLITNRSEDHPIHHYIFEDVNSEAKYIIKIIQKLHSRLHRGHNEIAVFYRTHQLGDKLETELRKTEIPVTRIKQKNSLKEGYMKDIMSYLNMLNWNLDRDIERAINFPQRLIDRFSMTKLKWLSRRDDLMLGELFQKIDDYKEEVPSLIRQNIKRFVSEIEKLKSQFSGDEKVGDIASKLLSFMDGRRSAYQNEELRVIRESENAEEHDKTMTRIIEMLKSAMSQQQPITITISPPPANANRPRSGSLDYYSAAYIISQTLKTYFDIDAPLAGTPAGSTEGETKEIPREGVHFAIGSFDVTKEVNVEDEENLVVISSSKERESSLTSLTALRLCRHLLEALSERSYEDIVVYDLETIGNNPKKAPILQIGALALDQNGEPERAVASGCVDRRAFNRLVKPPGRIPHSSTKIHRITNEDVADQPSIEGVLPEFMRFIEDKILVGHNIREFDNKIVDRELREHMDRGLVNECYDTLEMARKILPRENHNLEALSRKFEVDYEGAHRADTDAEITRQIFKKLVEIDYHRCVMRSLSEFLPLVGASILAEVGEKKDEINNPDSLVGAHYRAAVRYVQRNSVERAKLPALHKLSCDTVMDWLSEDEAQELQMNLRLLQIATLPQSEKDIAWQQLTSKFMTNVAKFEGNTIDGNLSDFLDYQKLITGKDEAETENSVTLMTLHSAKGTEFPFVFMIGMEDGVFPIRKTHHTHQQLEEARRLCYVGMTRAKERLYFTTVTHRDTSLERDASRFIREIPDEFINRWSAR